MMQCLQQSATTSYPAAGPTSPLLVWLLDTLCFTPWYTAALTSALMECGARVRLSCGEFSREPDYFNQHGLCPEQGPARLARFATNAPRSVSRVLRASDAVLNTHALTCALRFGWIERPDVIHLQQLPMLNRGLRADFKMLDVAQRLGVPVLHTVHNVLPHDSGERLRGAYAELYRRVDHLICHSPSAALRLTTEFGIGAESISIIPHGPLFAPDHATTKDEQSAARSRLGLAQDRPIALLQGILAEYKGLDVLIDAWKLCVPRCHSQSGSRPLLLIAGSGDARLEKMARDSEECGEGSVRADLGYISTSRLPDYYAAADILVYPYRAITTSGALLTGLSYGKPIVASDLEPFREFLVHDQNALLTKPGDAEQLAGSLSLLLLDLPCSRSGNTPLCTSGIFRRLAAGAAKNSVPSWSAIAQRTVALYRSLREASAPASSPRS